jgi:hypothetical protein
MGQKAIRALILRRLKKRSRPAVRAAAPTGHALKTPRGGPYSVIEEPHQTDTMITSSCNCWEEWLWERFYFRSRSRPRCLRLLPLRRRRPAASCAKLSDCARLVTVAPTSSPMPNGKPCSGASATAEFASSAIAFRGIDHGLEPRPQCPLRDFPSRVTNDARGCNGSFAKSWRRCCTARGRRDQMGSAAEKSCAKNFAPRILRPRILRPRSRAAATSGCAGLPDTSIELFIERWPT